MSDTSVYDRFRTAAIRWPDRAFLNVLPETASAYGIAAGEITYSQALTRIDEIAARYHGSGYGPGHRVGLLLQNRPEFLWHWLALNACGAGVVPINPDLRRAELEYLVSHSGMVLAVAIPARHGDLQAAGPAVPVIGPDATPPDAKTPAKTAIADPECALLYTSGTTGRPKGCILTNDYFFLTGDWYASVGGYLTLRCDPQDRMLTPLPLFHTNALAFSVMAVMTVGACLTVLDRFHPATWWQSVREARATIIHYLGVMPPLLVAQPDSPGDRDHHVRAGFGAGIDPGLHQAMEDRFGFPFVEGWAMTETGAGGVIMTTEDPRKPGTACFGRPRNEAEACVVRDNNTLAEVDEPGELLVRRAGADPRKGFFRGYLDDPDATAEAWRDGWLHTGDIVTRDADGDLHFIDRKKNIIRRSGENISAAEVESMLGQHPAVDRVAVAPVADELRGEEVLALIMRKPGQTLLKEKEITFWALEQFAYYKAPGWVAFVEDLPITATEKLQRGALRDLAEQTLRDGHACDTRHLKKSQ